MNDMQKFVRGQASTLLRRLAYLSHDAARLGTEDAIHDLRVGIRRLSECLREFENFFPAGRAKKVRAHLREVMKLAAEVRNRDIAMGLLKKAKVGGQDKLEGERRRAKELLMDTLRMWNRHEVTQKWREDLNV